MAAADDDTPHEGERELPVGVEEAVGAAPDADTLQHWASPEELLEMRSAWNEIKLQHQSEVQDLHTRIKALRAERDALRREVSEQQRLATLHAKSHEEYLKMREERNQWKEEREMLILRWQQASNDVLARTAEAGSSGASASHVAPRDALSEEDFSHLTEQLHRAQCESLELKARLEFQATADTLHRERSDQRLSALNAQLTSLKQRNAALEEEVLQSRTENEGLVRRTLEAETQKRRAEQEAEVKVAEAENQLADERKHRHDQMVQHQSALDAKDAEFKEKLNRAAGESQSTITQLEKTVQKALDSQEDSREALLKASRQFDADRAELRQIHFQEVMRLKDCVRSQQQRLEELESDNEELRKSVEEATNTSRRLSERCEGLDDNLRLEIVSNERCATEMVRLREKVDQLQQKATELANMESERDAFRERAIGFEKEVASMQEHFEKRESILAIALDVANRRCEDETSQTRKLLVESDRQAAVYKVKYKQMKAQRTLLMEKLKSKPLFDAYHHVDGDEKPFDAEQTHVDSLEEVFAENVRLVNDLHAAVSRHGEDPL